MDKQIDSQTAGYSLPQHNESHHKSAKIRIMQAILSVYLILPNIQVLDIQEFFVLLTRILYKTLSNPCSCTSSSLVVAFVNCSFLLKSK